MKPLKKGKEFFLEKFFDEDRNATWDWLYLRSHLVFATIIFIGMLLFIWWVTS